MSCNAILREGSKTVICHREHPHPDQCHQGIDRSGETVEWDLEVSKDQ